MTKPRTLTTTDWIACIIALLLGARLGWDAYQHGVAIITAIAITVCSSTGICLGALHLVDKARSARETAKR